MAPIVTAGDIDSVNHIGIAVRNLDAAASLYQRLGFTLSPLSVHAGSAQLGQPAEPMATGNRCAIFRESYVELLGIVHPGKLDWGWSKFLTRFQGAHIICFGCDSAEAVDARASAAGIETSGVVRLQRDVDTADGRRTARFDCVHFARSETPEGLVQAARHHNPEYLHQSRYMQHANGATALSEIVLVSLDPAATAERYASMTGGFVESVGVPVITLPRTTRLRFLSPAEAGAEYPGSLLPPPPCIASTTFTVTDLEASVARLARAGIEVLRAGTRAFVPAEEALGVIHVFRQG